MNDKTTTGATAPKAKLGEFDLGQLDTAAASDKGARIPIVHPTTKEPVGIFVKVLGKHSEIFRELVRERANKRIAEESMAVRRGKPSAPRTAEQVEQEALEMLVACTTGWETELKNAKGEVVETVPTIRLGEDRLTWSVATGLEVYRKFIWLRQQVDDGIGDLENFIKA